MLSSQPKVLCILLASPVFVLSKEGEVPSGGKMFQVFFEQQFTLKA